MKHSLSFLFFFLVILCTVYVSRSDGDFELLQRSRSKFMFQHSFKPPLVTNNKGHVPFWEHGGDAIPTSDQIRVCPSIQDRKGWLWNTYKFDGSNWMFDVTYSITGRNTYGADGMGFWFTSDKGNGGNMFGNAASFTGLGLIIDTFDNDGKGNSPKVSVFVSNGSLVYDHGVDGSNQELTSCIKQVRNLRYALKMKVIYYQHMLEVWMTDGNSNDTSTNYDLCSRSHDIYLPSSGYFGVSAATGGLSDDHDVMSFIVHKLTPTDQLREKMMENLDKAHSDRLKEYETFSQNFDDKIGHNTPKEVRQDWQKRLDLEENVRILHDMQSVISRDIRKLTDKVDQIVYQKTSTGGGGGGGGGMSEEKVLAMESRLSHHIQELRTNIGGAGGKVTASEQLQPLYQMKDQINTIQQTVNKIQSEIEVLRATPFPQGQPVTSSSCLSTWFFIFIILVQSAVVVGILFFKYNQERNAKKFF